MVQTVRQDFLQRVSKLRPVTKTIILIGPDHFSANQNQLNISDENWNLSTGLFKFYNQDLNLPINNALLKNDHAIYNPLADLKTYFPNATIYPILIGQKVNFKSLDSLINQITNICKINCLLVASVDFSHYLPATLAEAHDAYTINKLQNLDSLSIQYAEVDSPQSLYILEKFALLKNAKKYSLFAHTNSGFIANNPDVETTTHVFASYSRGFSPKITFKTTVSTPQNYDRLKNQNTLGDRFFYGVDEFIVDSSIDFVVSTITTPTQIIKSFLPIKDNLFIKGLKKQELIKNYFDSFPNDQNLTKDYFWGRIIYDRQ